MKPSLGRVVLYAQPVCEPLVNGRREHPAIVTHVFGDSEAAAVNLHVFFDGHASEVRGVVDHLVNAGSEAASWRWPDRVS